MEIGPDDGLLTVVTRWGEFTFAYADALVRESLRRMSLGPVSLANVTSGVPDRANVSGSGALDEVLGVLSGSVVHSLGVADDVQGPLLSVVPEAPAVAFRPPEVAPTRAVRLCRFAVMRPSQGVLVVESARAGFRVVLHRALARHVAAALVTTRTLAELHAELNAPEAVVAQVVGYLVAAGVALLGDAAGGFTQEDDPDLRRWTPHELMFHVRSRSTYGDDVASVPPAGPAREVGRRLIGPPIALPRPDSAAPLARDVPLTALLETQPDTRRISPRPLTVAQLGELLFRCARTRWPGPPAPPLPSGPSFPSGSPLPAEASGRAATEGVAAAPSRPLGGPTHLDELEIYLSIERCAGLPRGIYHYQPVTHAVVPVNDRDEDLFELVEMARVAAGSSARPPVLVTLTARVDRMAGAGDAAYAATLMHVGALQQLICLVAGAMGLRAYAVRVDANGAAERVLGLHWPAEVGVGECVLTTLS